MENLRVDLAERSYDIIIDEGILEGLGEALKSLGLGKRMALISNPTVYALYGEKTRRSLTEAGFEIVDVIIPDGEQHKDLKWMESIWSALLKHRLDRRCAIVALGGGVIGDMTGFAASAYMRGIPFIQIPTTLLAQVDSSVGGKTGVNHPLGKNMIGAFWQPSLVWIDTATLRTLYKREVLAGMAEVIKYGVIWDREFFDFLMNNKDNILALKKEAITHTIRRSCEIKAEVVSRDEREGGLRAILNYGHTIGHAVETTTGYTRYLHGEGVSIGMCAAATLSVQEGLMPQSEADLIYKIIELYEMPTELPEYVTVDALIEAMGHDKKTLEGTLRFVLPQTVGAAEVNVVVSQEHVRKGLTGLLP